MFCVMPLALGIVTAASLDLGYSAVVNRSSTHRNYERDEAMMRLAETGRKGFCVRAYSTNKVGHPMSLAVLLPKLGLIKSRDVEYGTKWAEHIVLCKSLRTSIRPAGQELGCILCIAHGCIAGGSSDDSLFHTVDAFVCPDAFESNRRCSASSKRPSSTSSLSAWQCRLPVLPMSSVSLHPMPPILPISKD